MAINDKAYKFSTRDDTTFRVSGGGGENGILVIIYDVDTDTLDKTWNEVNEALTEKKPCVIFKNDHDPHEAPDEVHYVQYLVTQTYIDEDELGDTYWVKTPSENVSYFNETPDGLLHGVVA